MDLFFQVELFFFFLYLFTFHVAEASTLTLTRSYLRPCVSVSAVPLGSSLFSFSPFRTRQRCERNVPPQIPHTKEPVKSRGLFSQVNVNFLKTCKDNKIKAHLILI